MLHTRPAAEERGGRQLTLHSSSRVLKAPSCPSASFNLLMKMSSNSGFRTAHSNVDTSQDVPKQLPSGSIWIAYPLNHLRRPTMAGFLDAKSFSVNLRLSGCPQFWRGRKGGNRHRETVAESWTASNSAEYCTNIGL